MRGSAGKELRFRHDLLPAVTGLARGGHLATDPLCIARLAFSLRPDRLVEAVVDSCSVRAVFGGCRLALIPPTVPSWAAIVI
jgi:hypothetical protein